MRVRALLLMIFSITLGHAAEMSIPQNCRQAMLVLTPDWDSASGTLQRYARNRRDEPWKRIGPAMPVMLGERGLGWGNGLHLVPEDGAPRKREGDRRAPAGIFRVTGAFGRGPHGEGSLPWQPLTPTLEAIDDPASRFYNRIVDRAQVERPDWRSSERMAAIPGYVLGLIVAHNPQNVPGAGSCIFMHLWRREGVGTAGCTALAEGDLRVLERWLDRAQRPVLIQLPREVAQRTLDGF